MTLSDDLKTELARLPPGNTSVRSAEVTTLLRFGGGLHIISGRLAIEVELPSDLLLTRVRRDLLDVYSVRADVSTIHAPHGTGTSYLLRIREGELLARQTGLIDLRSRPVRGLPNRLVASPPAETAAVWRGAFLIQGSLSDPGRSGSLEVACPGPESAMALVGAATRLGLAAKAREMRGAHRVIVREGDTIAEMLRLMGGVRVVAAWEDLRTRRGVRSNPNRLVNFDDANLRRSAQAAVAACARVARAMELLGSDIPEHLRYAGKLRLAHREASLDELGHHADPQLTKDAVAGRIRRLLAMADKRARELGLPGTEASVPPDLDDLV